MLLNHRTQNTTHGIYTLLKTPRILSQILKNPNTTCLPHMPYFIYIYMEGGDWWEDLAPKKEMWSGFGGGEEAK